MEMMVVIPIDSYEAMLKKCDDARVEYALLKNGVVTRDNAGKERVEILCDEEQAKQIVSFAATHCPEIVPSVKVIQSPVS